MFFEKIKQQTRFEKYVSILIMMTMSAALLFSGFPSGVTLRPNSGIEKAKAAIATNLVISEVQQGTSTSSYDEFIELYNPTSTAINLSTLPLKLHLRTSTGTDANKALTIKLGRETIPAFGFYLITSNTTAASYEPQADATYSLSGNTLVNNGGMYISDTTAADVGVFDKLGFGTQPTGGFETIPAANPPSDQSVERKANENSTTETMAAGGADEFFGNVWDTDDNSVDFVPKTNPEPQNSQSLTEDYTDKIKPTGTIIINEDAAYTNIATVSLNLSATDNTSVTQMRIANTTAAFETEDGWEDISTTKQWLLIEGDGQKEVYAQFKDASGNVSETVSDIITLDQATPITSKIASKLANVLGWHKTNVTVSLNVADTGGSGLDKIFYRVDSNTTKSLSTAPLKIGLTGNGIHKIYYYSIDKAQNKETLKSVVIKIDKTKPKLATYYPYPSTVKTEKYTKLYYKTTDNLSPKVIVTVKVINPNGKVVLNKELGAKAKAELLYYFYKAPAFAGTYKYIVIVKDYAGNIFTSSAKYFSVVK